MKPGDMRLAVLAITRHGVNLAFRVWEGFPGASIHVPVRHKFAKAMGAEGFERLGDVLPGLWKECDGLVCIMATGIVVRHVAPLLNHKSSDPAVVVLDEQGHYAISLLSGHLGGANELAREVARVTGGQAVITTASDVQGKPALDLLARDMGLEIESYGILSRFSRSVLEDEPVWIYDPHELIGERFEGLRNFALLREEPRGPEDIEAAIRIHMPRGEDGPHRLPHQGDSMRNAVGAWVSERNPPKDLCCVPLRPRNLVVGLGCNRGTPAWEIIDLVESVFDRENLSLLSIRNFASIDIKSDEKGLLEAAECLKRPVRFFSPNELSTVIVPNPSDMVAKHVGVQSVCEATALLSAKTQRLLVPKQKTGNVTLAVALVASMW